MDLEKRAPRRREPEGCLVVALRVPVRIVVFVLVVPVRMVWDALVVAGRLLRDTVLRPVGRVLAWIGRALFVWPLVGLWRYVVVPAGRVLGWLGNVIVVVPVVWLCQYVFVPVGRALRDALAWVYARVLMPVLVPLGRVLVWCVEGLVRVLCLVLSWVGTVLHWVGRVLVVLPVLALWRWVLAPVGRVIVVVAREVGDALGHAWRVAGRVSLAVGRALGTLLWWFFVEPARWLWRTVLTPVGQVVRDVVLRPVAAVARGVGRVAREALASARESVRLARADVRRMLFGEPVRSPAVDRREPQGAETRTLGSSTTALTKD